jgi:hypothetical protein
MKKKVGLIQTRNIGDLIIALPIADHFEELGYEVFWPIEDKFVAMFQRIKPTINFLPVELKSDYRNLYLNDPIALLQKEKVDRTIILYSFLGGLNICDTRLAGSVKFDEYKYAIAGVPFAKKWDLKYERDMQREEELFESLKIDGPYICVHDSGSDLKLPVPLPNDFTEGHRIVRIENLTDSPFDWRLTIERANKILMVDSCFANLVEQLNLPQEKRLVVRSELHFTPVYKNGWRFVFYNPEDAR